MAKKHDEHCDHDKHECDCGCEHDHNHEECDCDCGCEHDDLVVLQDENGNEVKFHYVYEMEHEGKYYVFLQLAEGEVDGIDIFEVQTVENDGVFYDTLNPVDEELYGILYEKLLLVASEDCCEDDGCDCHHHHDDDDK